LRAVDVNGVTLAYRVAGDPAAPPAVLLHGLGDDERDWRAVLSALAIRYRVYAPDLRGHGRSSHPGRYSFELMRDFSVPRCAAGHSHAVRLRRRQRHSRADQRPRSVLVGRSRFG
jgi:pimeloyl-ACP methyl ester carboxylesterase